MKFVVCVLFAVALVPAILAGDEKPASVWDLIRDYANHGAEPSAHVINGIEVKPNSYPHMALMSLSRNGGGVLCGGSLISPQWVMTAAHCVHNVQAGVILGAHNLGNHAEPTRQVIKVVQIIIEDKVFGDIALCKLEKPAIINQFVQPIRLPARSMQGKLMGGTPAEITGWGKFSTTPGGTQGLKVAPTLLMNNEDCKRRGFGGIKEFNICTEGLNGRGPCYGDSGGPAFITEKDGQRTQVGIASFVEGSCSTNYPGGWTRVDYFLDWINKHTGIPIRP